MQSSETFLLGTAVKVTTVLSVENATSVKITIYDPSNAEKLSLVSMSQDAPKVYSYVYQSESTDVDGDYVITITAVYGGKTSVKQHQITLERQAPFN